jgi:CO/xanthine dehydrogenase Mo-binding subunit
VREFTSKICGMPLANLKVNPAEIGGGFGGKTVVYVEPIAVMLSKKAGLPVRVAMTREEVFKASGPTSGASMHMKIGIKKDGTITAAEGVYKYQAGAFPGSPVIGGAFCGFAPYAIPNMKATAYDVLSNRPKVAAYRAPGSPIANYRHGSRRATPEERRQEGHAVAVRREAQP